MRIYFLLHVSIFKGVVIIGFRSSDGFVDWTFSTVRYWGERPQGTWKINVKDEGLRVKAVLYGVRCYN